MLENEESQTDDGKQDQNGPTPKPVGLTSSGDTPRGRLATFTGLAAGPSPQLDLWRRCSACGHALRSAQRRDAKTCSRFCSRHFWRRRCRFAESLARSW